ncbi:MAG TPA: lytic transglycosylase domain-containing protein [Abditibacterium sp.]|jgi:hypothetical protein
MRKFSAILCALLFCGTASTSAHAQGDYEAQKAKLQPVRFNSLGQLRGAARTYLGQVIELRGQVKGNFSRGENLSLLFQIAEGENILIEAAGSFRGSSALRPGTMSRLLCRLDGTAGNDVALSLVNATDVPESAALFKVEDNELLIAAPVENLPAPEQIMIGPDAPLAPFKITAPSKKTAKRGPAVLPSRGAQSRPASRLSARPASYGFDASQRSSYRDLARRTNPRLGNEMADYIAASILSAAETHSLDPRFLAAIVKVESSFDPYCLSSAGAMGLGQLMPFNLRPLGVANAWDPMQNLHGSAKMLRQNLNNYARQPNGTLLAVAAYHAGGGAVKRAGYQVPPKASTQKYVWKVYYAYRALAPELFR